MNDLATFAPRLIAWHSRHGRHDLPWQQTRDPYRIWLSEIMLQQTQVSTATPYYLRFLERFPDIATLAATAPPEVLEYWAGLGYYARARNLHRCAQILVAEHGGSFPESAERIAELPGIGRSTAAAIAAFAFGQRGAILDGNVKRVLTRVFGIEGFPGKPAIERTLWALAESLLPADNIESYTQGIMDLGATLCTRGRPDCANCPMRGLCIAERDGRQAELPTPKPAKPLPERESIVTVFTDGERILLERRPETGIWGGLLALPEGTPEALAPGLGLLPGASEALPELKHTFTHFRLTLRPIRCAVKASHHTAEDSARGLLWLDRSQLRTAALPAPIRKLLLALPQARR
ncbi:MAG: A/G-specific adenine glycosylase [Betaproteobacteria bacterium]|uniref:Adenine DNA glycosylase n=1 Tax=Candidatus Proximibacter danicus TaxID=2954365 RepID=A0A9D7K3M7_9PROT|nr:A/G-specific adenine glycosylase [Candidatus Proximibacter danicus]